MMFEQQKNQKDRINRYKRNDCNDAYKQECRQ